MQLDNVDGPKNNWEIPANEIHLIPIVCLKV